MPSSSKKYIFILLLVTGVFFGFFKAEGQDVILNKVDLPSYVDGSSVWTIYTSHEGFFWMGTSAGLLKYTGDQYRRYTADWLPSGELITAIGQDQRGMIWVGFENGDIAFLQENELVRFEPEEGTSSRRITSLHFDSNGRLWWGTYGEGIYYFNGARVYNIDREDGLADEFIYDLAEDGEGKIWAATDAGLSSCAVNGDEKTIRSFSVKDGLPDFIATSLFSDTEGKIWAGFDANGFCYIDPSSETIIIPTAAKNWEYGPVRDILRHKGTLWISTRDHGLLEAHPDRKTGFLVPPLENVTRSDFREITSDGMGNIWLLSDDGIFISTGIHFKKMTAAGDRSLKELHSILVDSSNRLWFSSDEGLFHYTVEEGLKQVISRGNATESKITSLTEVPGGKVCAASFGNGLLIIEPGSGKMQQLTSADGLINDHILSLTSAGNEVWLATLGGLSRCSFDKDGNPEISPFPQKENLGNSYIYTVFLDTKGTLWFGTDGKGLGRYDGHAMLLYDEQSGLDDDAIYSVTEDAEGKIWCSTSTGCIFRFNGRSFERMSDSAENKETATWSLNASGPYVIAVRQHGLELYDIRTSEKLLLNTEIGMHDIDADLNSTYKDEYGRIFVTTQEGVIVFDHEDADFPMKPVTVIESFTVFSVEMGPEQGTELRYNDNDITIDYSGLWYLAPGKVRYKVFLEGYDREWKNTFDDLAAYPNLSPGDYHFQVTSWLGDSPGTSSTAGFTFSIRSPFWWKAWFIIIVAILVLTFIYFFIRYRENQLRKIESRKKEKIEFEFQALKNQVNPHFLFNSFSTLISLIEDAPNRAVSYTEKLSDFFRKILQAKESELVPLSEELELINDYMFILEERFGHNIRLETSLDKQAGKTYILPMTLQMLVENVMKHNVISKDKPMVVELMREGDRLIVRNTLNPKHVKGTSTGLGLENIRKRYLLVTGKSVEFRKTDRHFVVSIPIIE